MRQVRYSVAMSLDGYIAGPKDEIDWIIVDPEIDFRGFMDRFDTILMGRKTFEAQLAHGGDGSMPGKEVIVVSRTLRQKQYPDATIVGDGLEEVVSRLRVEPGKDIWLFGGGSLFRSMLEAQLVDIVEVAVIPVLLGAGRRPGTARSGNQRSPAPTRASATARTNRTIEQPGAFRCCKNKSQG